MGLVELAYVTRRNMAVTYGRPERNISPIWVFTSPGGSLILTVGILLPWKAEYVMRNDDGRYRNGIGSALGAPRSIDTGGSVSVASSAYGRVSADASAHVSQG
jgi:hypothetical protein